MDVNTADSHVLLSATVAVEVMLTKNDAPGPGTGSFQRRRTGCYDVAVTQRTMSVRMLLRKDDSF